MDKSQNEMNNYFYANEDRRGLVKEYFQLFRETIYKKDANFRNLIDVGCATGDFLWYMLRSDEKENIYKEYIGMDNYDMLMDIAKERLPECHFIHGDITQIDDNVDIDADIVLFSGVLYLFQDFEDVFSNLLKLTHKGGRVYVYASFNEHGACVRHNYTLENGDTGCMTEFPKSKIESWCNARGITYEWIPFKIKTKIEPKDDPIRAYTVSLADGTYGEKDGLNIWRSMYLLRMEVK